MILPAIRTSSILPLHFILEGACGFGHEDSWAAAKFLAGRPAAVAYLSGTLDWGIFVDTSPARLFPGNERFFSWELSEAFLISLSAFMSATVARLGRGATAYLFDYHRGSFKILVASLGILICMYYFDLYDSSILRSRREIIIRLIQKCWGNSGLQPFRY